MEQKSDNFIPELTDIINNLNQKLKKSTEDYNNIQNIKSNLKYVFTQTLDKKSDYNEQNNKIIKLNVGGQLIQTTKLTLLTFDDTLFHKLLSDYENQNQTEIFLDRSPVLFAYILDFLRTKSLNIEKLKHEALLEDLLREIKYFNLSSHFF